jgi:hypothetical protein
MTDDHSFPDPNQSIENYRWSLEAEVPGGRWEWDRWRFRHRSVNVRIPLDLVDAPGGAADTSSKLFGRAVSEQFVENLARSAGIVLFYDPVNEFDKGDAFRHTYGVLTQLRGRAAYRGRKLPHYVAVCVTKFDDIRVFESALKLSMAEQEPEGLEFPRVSEDFAVDFFAQLTKVSRSDNAQMLLPLLQQTFHASRLKFYVTSAIGFYVDPALDVFDPDDYQNHVPGAGLMPDRIRGGVYPINVIEPVLWLGRNVARTSG